MTVIYQKSTSGPLDNPTSISIVGPALAAPMPAQMLAEDVLQG